MDLKYSEEKHRVLQFLYTDLDLLSRRSTPIDIFLANSKKIFDVVHDLIRQFSAT